MVRCGALPQESWDPMKFIVILITLSAHNPCPPLADAKGPCGDVVTRMGGFVSKARCERTAAWWRKRVNIIKGDMDIEDSGTAYCVVAPSLESSKAKG